MLSEKGVTTGEAIIQVSGYVVFISICVASQDSIRETLIQSQVFFCRHVWRLGDLLSITD